MKRDEHLSGAPDPIAQALPAAMACGELSLAYQPQVCLTSGRIIGAEALLRWESPRLGCVSPERFVAAAEASGQIIGLGRWVMVQACRQAAAWRRAGLSAVRVGVNVSPAQFRGDDVTALVQQALAESRLPATALGLEITEGALLHDADAAANALRPLQAEGVEIALDDFGTGYSSLSRLRDLPIDLVKIDRSYVHDVAAAASHASLTRSVIHLAHGMHLRVLAEGVETEDQLRLLLEHGCDRFQGWVFGKAVDAQAFSRLLAEGRCLPQALTHRREHQRTLLLVDDEEHILSALRRLFRRDGYRLLTATSGAQGLEVLAANAVDVIVSDQRMPGMTGVEFLRHAKEMRADTVRMTLSGYTDLQSIIDAVNEGAVYKFLTKPWDDVRLREHVAQAFHARELAEENRRLAREISSANTELAEANRRLKSLAQREQGRVNLMTGAADAARGLVDLMPVAVFGFDPGGLLVYVNRTAFDLLPAWAAGLGTQPDPDLLGVLEQAQRSPDAAVHVQACGLALDASVKALRDGLSPLGTVLMLAGRGPADDCSQGETT
jgi:EAL domain-containing protein (putative c-di-GMP-specific phosphodiesterase class I)/FixJ family two-component response regulator